MRAVIFDLWETLIDWDEEAAKRMVGRIEQLVEPGFRERWYASPNRYIAPVRISGPTEVNLLAVWAQNASAGVHRKHQLGPLRRGLATASSGRPCEPSAT